MDLDRVRIVETNRRVKTNRAASSGKSGSGEECSRPTIYVFSSQFRLAKKNRGKGERGGGRGRGGRGEKTRKRTLIHDSPPNYTRVYMHSNA